MPGKELSRQLIGLQLVTRPARGDDVARRMRAPVRERVYVIQRRDCYLEVRGTVDASATAVAHGGALDRLFE